MCRVTGIGCLKRRTVSERVTSVYRASERRDCIYSWLWVKEEEERIGDEGAIASLYILALSSLISPVFCFGSTGRCNIGEIGWRAQCPVLAQRERKKQRGVWFFHDLAADPRSWHGKAFVWCSVVASVTKRITYTNEYLVGDGWC